jgi:hypothetical protein
MVRVRRTDDEWLIEVRGEAIGRADTAGEAEALAVFWRGRMDCVARWRLMDSPQRTDLPESLTRLLETNGD